MLFRIGSIKKSGLQISPVDPPQTIAQGQENDDSDAERRRQMYERIAMGHALAEAEDNARRKWRGQ